jgi:acetylornithine deacetylase/succinyl-diaminopimelate desuccinylase-like protein
MDSQRLRKLVDGAWSRAVLPVLTEYIRIPNKSPIFDPEWRSHGHIDRAVDLVAEFCRSRKIPGLSVEVLRSAGRTPLLLMEIPGTAPDADSTVLLYGHLDKQPEFSGWLPGTAPFEPVRRGDRLYGRGSADDGYAAFASITALEALHRLGVPHARCVVLIESCEESGSYDLPEYITALRDRLGDVSLCVCLDSGCGDYERLWTTTSLRGLCTGNLVVEVLNEGVHSGDAGGVVASSFRIARGLLSRLEDEATGRIRLRELYVPIPAERRREARAASKVLGAGVWSSYPWAPGMKPVTKNPVDLLLRRAWQPSLSVIGADGLPPLASAGNVLRPSTTLKLSLRLPPTCDADRATRRIQQLLEKRPPYGARVRFEPEKGASGWNAPVLAPWLKRTLQSASTTHFGRDACAFGEGGSIPFMGMLGERFPDAQFVITGVLGPQSNAHGPNEFLHIPTAKKLTACVAEVLAGHAAHV